MNFKNFLFYIVTTSYVVFTPPILAQTHIEYLPTQTEWLDHATNLAKYWIHNDAKGNPEGNFPTWRCNDGSLRNSKTCKDEKDFSRMLNISQIDFVRMQSRQTYTYGALFNVTGNPKFLKLHKAGVKFLLESAKDPEGGFHSYMFNGKPYDGDNKQLTNDRLARTSQDLAYALVGLAMNAYLTHDLKVIQVIVETQKYIYDNYYDFDNGFIRWCLKDNYFDKKEQIELVAILDQLYSYMLLTWRLIPESEQSYWSAAIKQSVNDINKTFYNKDGNRHWGCTHDESCYNTETGRHQDNGHRVKSFWLQYLVANFINDKELKEFAKKGMIQTLDGAIFKNKDGWYEDFKHHNASWWTYDLLDITALTLALTDDYEIPNTFYPWLNNYTDKEYGDIKGLGLKTHLWRNGFHNSEHLLVGMILSNAIRSNHCKDDKCRLDNQTTLFFAPINNDDKNFFPYLFKGAGEIQKYENKEGIVKIKFKNIKL